MPQQWGSDLTCASTMHRMAPRVLHPYRATIKPFPLLTSSPLSSIPSFCKGFWKKGLGDLYNNLGIKTLNWFGQFIYPFKTSASIWQKESYCWEHMLFILHFTNTNICTTQIYHAASDYQGAEQCITQETLENNIPKLYLTVIFFNH